MVLEIYLREKSIKVIEKRETEKGTEKIKKPEKCPKCGSPFIDYNPIKRQYECLVRKCSWFLLDN